MPEAWDFLDLAGDSTVADSAVDDTISSLEEDSVDNDTTNARNGNDRRTGTGADEHPNNGSSVMQHIMQNQPSARLSPRRVASPTKKSKSRTDKEETKKTEGKERPATSKSRNSRSAKPRSIKSSSEMPRAAAAAADGDAVDLALVNDLARTLSGYLAEAASPRNITTTLQDLYILPDFEDSDDSYSDTADLPPSDSTRGRPRRDGGRERRGDAGYRYWASAVGLNQDESTVSSSTTASAGKHRGSGKGRRRAGNRSSRSSTSRAATGKKAHGKGTAKASPSKKSKNGSGTGKSRLERKIAKARHNSSKIRRSKSRVELLGADYETSLSSHQDASASKTKDSATAGTASRGGFRILLSQPKRSTKGLLVSDDEAEDRQDINKTSKSKRRIESSKKNASSKSYDSSSGSDSSSRAKVDFLSDLREIIKDIKGAVDMVSPDLPDNDQLANALLGNPSNVMAPLLSQDAGAADVNEAPRTNKKANMKETPKRREQQQQQQQNRSSQPVTIGLLGSDDSNSDSLAFAVDAAKMESATKKQDQPSQKEADTCELLRGDDYPDDQNASQARQGNLGRRKIRNLGRVVLHAVKVGSGSSGINSPGKCSSGRGSRSFVILPPKKSSEKEEDKPTVYSQYLSDYESDDADCRRTARITVIRHESLSVGGSGSDDGADLDVTADTPIRVNYKKTPEKDNPPKEEEQHEKEKKEEQHEKTAAYAQLDVNDNSDGIVVPQVKSVVTMDTIRESLFGALFVTCDDEENGDNAESRDQLIIRVAELIDTIYDDNLSVSVSRMRARKIIERYKGKEEQLVASLKKKIKAKEARKKERARKYPSLDDASLTDATEDISSPEPSPSSKHRPSDTFVPKLTSPMEVVDTVNDPWYKSTMSEAIDAVVPQVTSVIEDIGESKLVESLYKQFSRIASADESESDSKGKGNTSANGSAQIEGTTTVAEASKAQETNTDKRHKKRSERPDRKKSFRKRNQSNRSKAAAVVGAVAAAMAFSKKSKRRTRKNRNVSGNKGCDNASRVSQEAGKEVSRSSVHVRGTTVSARAPVCPVDLDGEIYSKYSPELPTVEEEEAGEEVSLSDARLGATTVKILVAARAPVCPVDLDEDVSSDSDGDVDEEGEEVSFDAFDQIVNPKGNLFQAIITTSTLSVETKLSSSTMPRSGTNLESFSTEVDLESFVKLRDCHHVHDDGKVNIEDDGSGDEKSVDNDTSGYCSGEGIELFVEFDDNDDIATLRASLGNDTFLKQLSVHLEVYMLLDTIYGKAPTEDYAQKRATAVLDRFAGREDLVVAALRKQVEDEAAKQRAQAAKHTAGERADATNGDNANGGQRRSSKASLLKKMVTTKSSRSVNTVVAEGSSPPTGEIKSNPAALSGSTGEPEATMK